MEDYTGGSAHSDINRVFDAFETNLALAIVWAEEQSDEELRAASIKWRSAPKHMTLLHYALRTASFPLARRILEVTDGQAANAITGSSNNPLSWSCLHILSDQLVATKLASGHGISHEIPLATMMEELICHMGDTEIAWKIKGG